jgi:predicted enzyme related to lactoylglutathione lyase
MLRVIEFAFTGYSISDAARSRDFYENTLNLTPAMVLDRGGKCWIEYEIGPHVLAISNLNEEWKPSPSGGLVALEVEDFDTAIASLKEKGVKFYIEPYASPVCRLAVVADPDGNSICIHKRNPP